MNTTPRKYYEAALDMPAGGGATPSGKKLTPMAKFIVWIDEQFEKSTNPAEYSILTYARNVATSLLPEEIEMAIDNYTEGCNEGLGFNGIKMIQTATDYFTNNYQQ